MVFGFITGHGLGSLEQVWDQVLFVAALTWFHTMQLTRLLVFRLIIGHDATGFLVLGLAGAWSMMRKNALQQTKREHGWR